MWADLTILPSHASDAEARLIELASGRFHNDPTDEELGEVTAREGIDFATAALYGRIVSNPERRAFIRRINTAEQSPGGTAKPRVLVMPGAFHIEYPHTGASGERVMELAAELGWCAQRVPLPSLAPMSSNAAELVRVLKQEPGRPTLIVSLSKGGTDVRAAFEREDAAETMKDVSGWVSLSGMLAGTPLVAWLRARPIRCSAARALLRWRGQRFAVLDELRSGPGSALDRTLLLPATARLIHVAGFPMIRHLSGRWSLRGHSRLAPLGPNDGGGILLNHLTCLPGDLYPVWGCDHYLRPPWDIRPILLRILQEAAGGTGRAPPSPTV